MSSRRRSRRSMLRSLKGSARTLRAGARASEFLSLQPYDLEGSVDDLNRPLVRIETPGFTDPLLAFVDTGFNGALLLDERQAARLGLSVERNSPTPVRLASR